LKLQPIEEKEVTLASGSRKLVPYVRPVEIKNRAGFVVRWWWVSGIAWRDTVGGHGGGAEDAAGLMMWSVSSFASRAQAAVFSLRHLSIRTFKSEYDANHDPAEQTRISLEGRMMEVKNFSTFSWQALWDRPNSCPLSVSRTSLGSVMYWASFPFSIGILCQTGISQGGQVSLIIEGTTASRSRPSTITPPIPKTNETEGTFTNK
jgi:hypothetical protein